MKLTSAQHAVLSSGLRRNDGILQLPANLKGGAAQKLAAKLLADGLSEELAATGSMPVWRKDDDHKPIALRITAAGLEAIQGSPDVKGSAKATKKAWHGPKENHLKLLELMMEKAITKTAIGRSFDASWL